MTKILFLSLLFPFAATAGLYIHPSMQTAIKANDQAKVSKKAPPTFVTIDGVKRHTGFNPTSDFYANVKVIQVKADPELIAKYKAQGGLDYRKISYSPVRGQIQGSCWAEAAGSVHELNYNRKHGTKEVFAVQDYIDCSGYGTARNGGQIALPYGLKGIAKDSAYKYTGVDGRCRTDVERVAPFEDVSVIRGENGGFPTEPELLTAFFTYGAMEVCGSASALGSGGRQDTIRSGVTNHCYGLASARPGSVLGWLDAWYFGMKNSWGDGLNTIWNLVRGNWGDMGWGDYRLSTDGLRIRGSVVTEIMTGYFGEYTPPGPVEFKMGGSSDLTVTVNPGAVSVEKAKASLTKAGFSLKEAK